MSPTLSKGKRSWRLTNSSNSLRITLPFNGDQCDQGLFAFLLALPLSTHGLIFDLSPDSAGVVCGFPIGKRRLLYLTNQTAKLGCLVGEFGGALL